MGSLLLITSITGLFVGIHGYYNAKIKNIHSDYSKVLTKRQRFKAKRLDLKIPTNI